MINKIINSEKVKGKINSYDWDDNNNYENLLTQIYYNTFRITDKTINDSAKCYEKFGLLYNKCCEDNNNDGKLELLKLICHIRDIDEGKGEYNLSYLFLFEIYNNSKYLEVKKSLDEIIYIIKFFVNNDLFINEKNKKSYGSWKDIKYFCDFLKNKKNENLIREEDFKYLVTELVSYHNEQIIKDIEILKSNGNNLSLAAKWIPREKSHFGWLYYYYINDYFKIKINNSYIYPKIQYTKTFNYYAKLYRKNISDLSKKLEVTQIYQCNGKWKEINFENITSLTLSKQIKAFLIKNSKKNNVIHNKHINSDDRQICKKNFELFINNVVKVGSKNLNSKHINLGQLVSEAIKANKDNDILLKDIINNIFINYCYDYNIPNDYIVIADNSYSMKQNEDAYYNLIGLSIMIANNSKFSKRILCFGKISSWINLCDGKYFCDHVEAIMNYNYGKGSNLNKCIDLLIETVKKEKINKKIKIIILSDMKIDNEDNKLNSTLNDVLTDKFKIYKNQPEIILWNFVNKNNFPILYNRSNSILLSGYTPNILIKGYNENLINDFINCSYDKIKEWNPYLFVKNTLDKDRYKNILL